MKQKKAVLITILFISFISYAQNRNFGVGIQLGEPTGLNAKMWTNNVNAFDFGLAWSLVDREEMIMQTDYVWHSFDVFPVSRGELPVYFGIGARFIFSEDPLFGARVPVGLAYMLDSFPLDIFFEIAPVLNLIPSTGFDLNGGFGVRFRI
jgi:hypothetical protein